MFVVTAERARRMFGGAALNLAALTGCLCIVLATLGWMFGITVVLFKTGSMAPTIPAGSAAIVQPIAASEINVGDVVMVSRPDAMPVTHRVTTIESVSGATATFTMQGDANREPDPVIYTESAVGIVRWSVPGIAQVVAGFGDPRVLVVVTLGAAVLVGWAFWPRRDNNTHSEIEEMKRNVETNQLGS